MNELEEIMNGKHEIKHLKIDNDTLTFNTELNNYDWNLTPRDIEMIIYALQEDKNNLQSKIDKAIEYIDDLCKCSDGTYFNYGDDLSPKHIVDILKEEQSKETKELFEGTMDQLNDLSIFKEDK